ELGALLAGMLGTLCDRGPDSAGFAVYGEAATGRIKLTLRAPQGFDLEALLRRLAGVAGAPRKPTSRDTHAVISVHVGRESEVRTELARTPDLDVVGSGRRMEIFKEVGRPDGVA